MIVVTGANGQLGRLVIEQLLTQVPAGSIVAAVREPAKATDLRERGVQLRHADYDQPATLNAALAGATKVLLISSSEIGQRVAQHGHVVDAAVKAGVELLAYTSILQAPTSPLALAAEHLATERRIQEAGIPSVILRNGWYTENYLQGAAAAIALGTLYGCAGTGRTASAARKDYADAAAAVLTQPGQAGKVYELAGDEAYTMAEFAQELHRVSGKPVSYADLPEAEYQALLTKAGLPPALAAMLADSQAGVARGGLAFEERQLSQLIGRPTTAWTEQVRAALG